jgi:hypothetical protein
MRHDEGSDGDVLINKELGRTLQAEGELSVAPFRLGIACMTKRPLCFEAWLAYHVSIGVERFYLRVEDTPALAQILERPRWKNCVEATFHTGLMRDWTGQSQRQDEHVQKALALARAEGLTHLLHIDDDELLYFPFGSAAMRAVAEKAPPSCASLHLRNLEALMPSATCTNPYGEARAFRHRPNDYGAYGRAPCTGKSIAILSSSEVVPNGPHFFALATSQPSGQMSDSPTHVVPPAAAVLLHFESVVYERWRDKFTEVIVPPSPLRFL